MTTDFARERRLRDLDEEMREAIQATDKQRTIAALEGRLTMEKRGRGRPRNKIASEQVSVRLPPDLQEEIAGYIKEVRTESGFEMTQSDAIRTLLRLALRP
jgi:uncharacterized protein (DUF4415 family)